MLNIAQKIKLLKHILYKEKVKVKGRGNKNRNGIGIGTGTGIGKNKESKKYFLNIHKGDKYGEIIQRENVQFIYKDKTLIQVIEYFEKGKSLFLIDDNKTESFKNGKENDENNLWREKNSSSPLKEKEKAAKSNKQKENSVSCCNGSNLSEVKRNVRDGDSNAYNESEYYARDIFPSFDKKKQMLEVFEDEKVYCESKKDIVEKKRRNDMAIINKFLRKYDQIDRRENRKNKLIIKYEVNNKNDILVILNKCKQYNYINIDVFKDICLFIYKNEEIKNVEYLLTVTNAFIHLNYYDETYYNFLFSFFLNVPIYKNAELISLFSVLSKVKTLNTLHILLFYKINFMFLHRLYSFSLNEIYNLLKSYIRIHKNIDKEIKKGKSSTECSPGLNERQTQEERKKISSVNTVLKINTFINYYKSNYEDNKNKEGTINSENFKSFYLLDIRESQKKRESVHFIFFLINCLRNEKIKIENIGKFLRTGDCLNKNVFSYIKVEIAKIFLKKVKIEYPLFNRRERKELYQKRDFIVEKLKNEQKKKNNSLEKTNEHQKNNTGANCLCLDKNKEKSVAAEIVKDSEKIQLKLINRMKKKVDARIFIPFLKISDCHYKLIDFFTTNYKHMNLQFNEKSVLITLHVFSLKKVAFSEAVLHMLTCLIKRKINYFTSNQIVDIMNSYSYIKNKRISNNLFNFLIRFLFNNNKIIYLKDDDIHKLINALIRKKYFLNEDAIRFITFFIMNHKPIYKNLKNFFTFLFFHYHFNTLKGSFLSSLYCSVLNQKNIKFENINKVLASMLLISDKHCVTYQKEIFQLIDTVLLFHLKRIYEKRICGIKDLYNISDFLYYFNGLMSDRIYKSNLHPYKFKTIKKNNCWDITFTDGLRHYRKILKKKNCSLIQEKKKRERFQYIHCRHGIRYYCAYNPYDKAYTLHYSFQLELFFLINKILDMYLREGHMLRKSDEVKTNLIDFVLAKILKDLHCIEQKTIQINKKYTYVYVNKKELLKGSKRNKTANAQFLNVIDNIKNTIVSFIKKVDENRKLCFLFYIMKRGLVIDKLEQPNFVYLHLKKRLEEAKYQKGRDAFSISEIVFWTNFISSYRINEIVFSNGSINQGDALFLKGDEDKEVEIETQTYLMEALFEHAKRGDNKKNELTSIIYNEKKRKVHQLVKTVIHHFFVTYRCKKIVSAVKYGKNEKEYISRVLKNYDRKIIKRKIQKWDTQLKKNNSYRNINKYNKFLINKFMKRWKKRKTYLILKHHDKFYKYINASDLIELLFSVLVLATRHLVQKRNKRKNITCLHEKILIFLLNKCVVLKKPQAVNITYQLYLRFVLSSYVMQYMFYSIFKKYFYILKYWKQVLLKSLSNQKTFRNYSDYTKYGSFHLIGNEKFDLIPQTSLYAKETSRGSNERTTMINNCAHANNSDEGMEQNQKYSSLNQLIKGESDESNLMNYPSISQTSYKYKLNDKNYCFEHNMFFKNCDKYKNLMFHNIFEEYSYLQKCAQKLFFFFKLFEKMLKRKKQTKYLRLRTKKKTRNLNKMMNSKRENSNVLFKNAVKIKNIEKIELFHNHIIKVDVIRNDASYIQPFFFFIYASFNLNFSLKKYENKNCMVKSGENVNFLKRETFFNLILVDIILKRHYLMQYVKKEN